MDQAQLQEMQNLAKYYKYKGKLHEHIYLKGGSSFDNIGETYNNKIKQYEKIISKYHKET